MTNETEIPAEWQQAKAVFDTTYSALELLSYPMFKTSSAEKKVLRVIRAEMIEDWHHPGILQYQPMNHRWDELHYHLCSYLLESRVRNAVEAQLSFWESISWDRPWYTLGNKISNILGAACWSLDSGSLSKHSRDRQLQDEVRASGIKDLCAAVWMDNPGIHLSYAKAIARIVWIDQLLEY